MTLVDTADLAGRACRVCGAVVGDALRHRRWHAEEDERTETTLGVLRALTNDLERRAETERRRRHPSSG